MQLKLTLILIAFHNHISQQTCPNTQAPYPKIVGGKDSDTILFQIDYHQSREYLVAVGTTYDQGLRGDTFGAYAYPMVITYKSDIYYWGKYLFFGYAFSGVKINKAGSKMVLVSTGYNPTYILVMDIDTGNVQSSIAHTMQVELENIMRNLLFLDDGNILITDIDRIIKFLPPTTVVNAYTLSGLQTIGLQCNSAQSYLHAFSMKDSDKTAMISVMDMTTFNVLYQFSAQLDVASNLDFQTCIFEVSATVDTIVFQEYSKYFRIQNQYLSSTFITSTVHDPANQDFHNKGLYCYSSDLVYSLLLGSFFDSGFNMYRILVAEVNFQTNRVIYRRYLQQTFFIQHSSGIIYGSNKFFLGNKDIGMYSNEQTYFEFRSPIPKFQGLIYSPMLTCQLIDETIFGEAILIQDGFSFNRLTIQLFSLSTLAVEDKTAAHIGAFNNIVSTEFEGYYVSNCIQIDYANINSNQATKVLQYFDTDINRTFLIDPFRAIKQYSTLPDPVFTYTLQSFSGAANLVQVNAATGDIFIPSIYSLGLGSYKLVIKGELQDCQTITATFILRGYINFDILSRFVVSNLGPPVFTVPLDIITLKVGDIMKYTLPHAVDPDEEDQIIILVNRKEAAIFSYYDISSQTITFEVQRGITYKAEYKIAITLKDDNKKQKYTNYKLIVRIEKAQTNQQSQSGNSKGLELSSAA
ncbi:hypothetical protein FGO68_gene3519 [Halteria grandinella]|uniref:Uncharacterized protein n=1 Tax=Halteria grandinella TaxID=5974 RepID=A0A8J8P2G0_HALGN|nr:hypothetical protein FGO68_gene3519 [Halteria grandinella]